jgi:hypothetical protein
VKKRHLFLVVWGLWCLTFAVAATVMPPFAWAQKTPALADRHKAGGIGCPQCHQGKPGERVASGTCGTCHGDVSKGPKKKEEEPDPHRAHVVFSECTDCHHGHKASENKCDGCHNFGVQAP